MIKTMTWVPDQIGHNKEEVFIIGGGTSLRGFDWKVLEPLSTIGCNHAFRLGEKVCDVCVFGDHKFFSRFHGELKNYKGLIVTNNRHLFTQQKQVPWIKCMKYERRGLHTHALGWNDNTGAVAINLAILMGFKSICLLGFDMCLSEKREPNYHKHIIDIPCDSIYKKFQKGFTYLKRDLDNKFPDVEIINLNPKSDLELFPKMTFEEYMEGKKYAMVS